MGKGRAPCCEKGKVKRGPWSPAEDLKLITFIQKNGHDNWRALPKQSGLLRCGKSCRLRWINYLRPDVKRGNFTKEEEEKIIKLHESLGNKWSKIASHFPGRTDNEIKNVWNTHLKKKLAKIASPSVDESKESSLITSSSSSSTNSNLSCKKRDSGEIILLEEETGHKRSCTESITRCENIFEDNKEDEDDNASTKSGGESNDSKFSTQVEQNPNQQEKLSATTSSGSSCCSNGSRTTTTTQIDHQDSSLGNHEEEMLVDALLLDFQGPFDVEALLQEVNQPDQEVMPLLLDDNHDDSFWDIFGANTYLGTKFDSNNNQEVQVLEYMNSPPDKSCQKSIFKGEKDGDIVNNNEWFRFLENELGLEATMADNGCEIEQVFEDQDYHTVMVNKECNFCDLDLKPEFSYSTTNDLWPSN